MSKRRTIAVKVTAEVNLHLDSSVIDFLTDGIQVNGNERIHVWGTTQAYDPDDLLPTVKQRGGFVMRCKIMSWFSAGPNIALKRITEERDQGAQGACSPMSVQEIDHYNRLCLNVCTGITLDGRIHRYDFPRHTEIAVRYVQRVS
ncbi:hypothetical protein TNCV_4116681 [Trichonephila clavipes]|nr:hypothetical protein TNCV_4116681 [Trichonephila clavipes]